MKNSTAITYELDDSIKAARELAGMVDKNTSFNKNNAVGILLCDADMDGAAVTGELNKLLGIEIAGMTTLATLDRDGYHEAAAVFTVLSDDGCSFIASASEVITEKDYETKIADVCRAVLPEERGDKNGLIFAYCPNGMTFSGDMYTEILSKEAGNVPVIGGIASDDYDFKRARVFFPAKNIKILWFLSAFLAT